MFRTVIVPRGRLALMAGLLSVLTLGFIGSVQADTVTIEMLGGPGQGDFRFSPAEVTVKMGDTVEWINMSPSPILHTATYGMGNDDPLSGFYFDSGFLATGGTYSVTLTRMGVYHYYCIPHELFDMRGILTVGHFQHEAVQNEF